MYIKLNMDVPIAVVFSLAFLAVQNWQPVEAQQYGSVVDQLQRNGVLSENSNICAGINCGHNAQCVPYNIGPSTVKNYRCTPLQHTTTRIWRPLPGGGGGGGGGSGSTVPQCYDKVEIQVPVGSYGSGVSPSMARSACRNECPNGISNCARGQICCMKGCDRICYTPQSRVVDYSG